MSNFFKELNSSLQSFIEQQKVFFVATAAQEGSINLSPKGLDSIKILNSKTILWLNLTGSGNETSAHILKQNRITLMFCAFEGNPLILRVYGKAKEYMHGSEKFNEHIASFPNHPGARQIFEVEIERVQTSCGYAVPLMEFKEERSKLNEYNGKQTQQETEDYWNDNNKLSIDGYETNVK
jgi:hypothetical protein